MSRVRFAVLFFILIGCAACGPDGTPAVVPTLMEFPTDTLAAPVSESTGTRTPPPTWTATFTPTAPPTATPTPLPSATSTATATPTVTPSLTITPTPTATASATWTITPTHTRTEEPRALSGLVALALQATILPPTAAPVQPPISPLLPATSAPVAAPPCANPPTSGFSVPFASDPTLPALLGCPVGTDFNVITAVQTFERGMMIYVSGQPGSIYALYNTGAYRRYDDTFVEGADPETSGETPPAGFLTPVRGFLKIWSSNPDVRANLGWAITQEAGNESRILQFERGRMIYLPQRNQTVALGDDAAGTWRVLQGGG